jgi:hypothetical protein
LWPFLDERGDETAILGDLKLEIEVIGFLETTVDKCFVQVEDRQLYPRGDADGDIRAGVVVVNFAATPQPIKARMVMTITRRVVLGNGLVFVRGAH